MKSVSLSQMAHLSELYSQPHRHYHNLSHIMACLRELDTVEYLSSGQKAAVEFALWFHDAYYDPRAGKGVNEDRSASLAASECPQHLNATLVSDMIYASAHHASTGNLVVDTFLDIDLSILGQDASTYTDYAISIQKEYNFIPTTDFALGRSAVLHALLERENIFATSFFRDKYEVCARKNIKEELAVLTGMI